MKILCQFYPVSYYSVCAISFSPSHSASSPVAGPGARKPSVGEGKESSQPLVCSALVYFLFFSFLFFYISAPILACEIIIIIIIGHGLQSTTNDVYVFHSFGLAWHTFANFSTKNSILMHTYIGTVPQALVTQLMLRLRAPYKDPSVEEGSNFLCISY